MRSRCNQIGIRSQTGDDSDELYCCDSDVQMVRVFYAMFNNIKKYSNQQRICVESGQNIDFFIQMA